MSPRLRVLRLDADRVMLVLDGLPQMGSDLAQQAAARLDAAAKRAGAAGLMVFDGPVDIPDSDPEPESGVVLYPDEAAALEWALGELFRMPVGGSPGELHPASEPARQTQALQMLLDRAQESRATGYRSSPA